ncbi:unnamed protein product [Symbiodinium sp. CCMP2592]|nr:unnamed protein product [Symbiodinium sp. CCMP2592]
MGQGQSLTAPCCAARERLNSDFQAGGGTSLQLTATLRSSRDEWADVEAPSPLPETETEMSPESDGRFASETAHADELGSLCGGSLETRSCRNIVTLQVDKSPKPEPQGLC